MEVSAGPDDLCYYIPEGSQYVQYKINTSVKQVKCTNYLKFKITFSKSMDSGAITILLIANVPKKSDLKAKRLSLVVVVAFGFRDILYI